MPDDRKWLERAIELARECPPSTTAFSVGAFVVGADGAELARGFSRETPLCHAEESALAKLPGARLVDATLYSSLEPCTRRASRPRTCTELIIEAGVGRVVIAWREPAVFVRDARGAEALAAAGVTVVELPALAEAAASVNAHLLGGKDGGPCSR